MKRSDDPINRVKCVVNTCQYYMNGDHCCAEEIQVQPKNAVDYQQTDCGTFMPNEEML